MSHVSILLPWSMAVTRFGARQVPASRDSAPAFT